MRLATHRPVLIGLSIAMLVGHVGCAARAVPVAPVEKVRPQLGTVGVVSGHFVPDPQYSMPAKGGAGGAKQGAGRFVGHAAGRAAQLAGAGVNLMFGTGGASPVAPLLLIAAPAVILGGALVGSIWSAVEAPGAESVEKAEGALNAALADLSLQASLRNRVAALAEDWTRHRVVLLPEHGPTTRDSAVSYQPLAPEGVETVLEVSVSTVELKVTGRRGPNPSLQLLVPGPGQGPNPNPSLQLLVTVRARLVRAAYDTELYSRAFEYRGGTRKFTEWGEDDAQAFQAELARVPDALAGKIVYELLCVVALHSPCDHRDGARG